MPVIGIRRMAAGLLAATFSLAATGCMPLPFRRAPEISGRVVDESTGRPLANAIVVLRADARTHDILPDRDLIGHLEARTDSDGRFRAGPIWKSGLSLWPLERTEIRIVGVMREGYRCARPVSVLDRHDVYVPLTPALDRDDRRQSCRPVSAGPREAPMYLAAWNDLYPPEVTPDRIERERELNRLLEARDTFGFGQNCEGPIADLALAPEGVRAAYLNRNDAAIDVVALGRRASRTNRVPLPELAANEGAADTRRLAWTGPDELVLWEPAGRLDRARSLSVLSVTGSAPQVVWKSGEAAPPVSATHFSNRNASRRPLEPADLNDEGDALWLGRSFSLHRALDPETGLGTEVLRITEEDGETREIQLPGETCGPRGQFGRPHYRIAADTRTALDLRYVHGGCHAVAIDLTSGAWGILDDAENSSTCREVRRVPASQMVTAVRGYVREIETALEGAGADPNSAYSIELAADGGTVVVSRDLAGGSHTAPLPPFPIATPLRRIDVTLLSGGGAAKRAPENPEYLDLEPL